MRTIQVSALAILFVIFPNPSFAQTNPALSDVREVSVVVTIADSEPNKYGLNPTDIKSKVIDQLSNAGIKSTAYYSSNIPAWFSIDLEIIKVESCGQYVIYAQTSLARSVTLGHGEERFSVIADVWKIDSGVRIMTPEKIINEIPTIVREQVQAFIAACPPEVSIDKKVDVNQAGSQLRKVTTEKDTKPAKQQEAEAKFVASKNSKVFHKPDCQFAQKIKPENLISYATRDEAVAAGKRPCKSCNP